MVQKKVFYSKKIFLMGIFFCLLLSITHCLLAAVQYTATQFMNSYPVISTDTDIILDVPFIIAVEEPFVFTANATLTFHTDPNNPDNARVELGSGAVSLLRIPTMINPYRVIAFVDTVNFIALSATSIVIGDGVSMQRGRMVFRGNSRFVQQGGV